MNDVLLLPPPVVEKKPIDLDLIKKAERENTHMAGYIAALHKFGIAGMENERMFSCVLRFLTENQVAFAYNRRFLIWLPGTDAGLVKIFQQK